MILVAVVVVADDFVLVDVVLAQREEQSPQGPGIFTVVPQKELTGFPPATPAGPPPRLDENDNYAFPIAFGPPTPGSVRWYTPCESHLLRMPGVYYPIGTIFLIEEIEYHTDFGV